MFKVSLKKRRKKKEKKVKEYVVRMKSIPGVPRHVLDRLTISHGSEPCCSGVHMSNERAAAETAP